MAVGTWQPNWNNYVWKWYSYEVDNRGEIPAEGATARDQTRVADRAYRLNDVPAVTPTGYVFIIIGMVIEPLLASNRAPGRKSREPRETEHGAGNGGHLHRDTITPSLYSR